MDKSIKVPDIKYALIQFLQDNNLEATLTSLQAEMKISESTVNYIRLETFMKNLDFINALNYVEYFMSKELQRSRGLSKNTILMTCKWYNFS